MFKKSYLAFCFVVTSMFSSGAMASQDYTIEITNLNYYVAVINYTDSSCMHHWKEPAKNTVLYRYQKVTFSITDKDDLFGCANDTKSLEWSVAYAYNQDNENGGGGGVYLMTFKHFKDSGWKTQILASEQERPYEDIHAGCQVSYASFKQECHKNAVDHVPENGVIQIGL